MTEKCKSLFDSLASQSSFRRYLRTLTWIAGLYLASLHGVQLAIGNDLVEDANIIIVLRFSQFVAATVLGMLILSLTVRVLGEYLNYMADQDHRSSNPN